MILFWNPGISWFQNEASGKTKMDAIAIFMDPTWNSFKLENCLFMDKYNFKWII